MSDPEKASATDFGLPFDYDATAEASLSEQPGSSESVPPHGSTPTSGPGWDTYAGVGNGPGWGAMPSYPAPADQPPVESAVSDSSADGGSAPQPVVPRSD